MAFQPITGFPCVTCGALRTQRRPTRPPSDTCYICSRSRPLPLAERFWEKVDKAGPTPDHRPELGPCWIWTAGRDRHGYGQINVGPEHGADGAPRVAFFLAEGRWPTPCCLHHCDNPACVRRDHLFEGTRADNNRDMARKGRHVGNGYKNRTTCIHGHPFTPANTYTKQGTSKRTCRTCVALRKAKRRAQTLASPQEGRF